MTIGRRQLLLGAASAAAFPAFAGGAWAQAYPNRPITLVSTFPAGSAPDGFTDVNAVLSFEERKAIVRGYAGAAGFAQSQVNRPQDNHPDNHPGRAA